METCKKEYWGNEITTNILSITILTYFVYLHYTLHFSLLSTASYNHYHWYQILTSLILVDSLMKKKLRFPRCLSIRAPGMWDKGVISTPYLSFGGCCRVCRTRYQTYLHLKEYKSSGYICTWWTTTTFIVIEAWQAKNIQINYKTITHKNSLCSFWGSTYMISYIFLFIPGSGGWPCWGSGGAHGYNGWNRWHWWHSCYWWCGLLGHHEILGWVSWRLMLCTIITGG